MTPRHTFPRLGRPVAAGLVLWALVAFLQPAEARAGNPAGNARLLASDEAAVIQHPVLGLQRSALPLAWGFALDTSVLADAALAPNLGLRWALEAGPHRFVVGTRYTQFMGAQLVSDFVSSQQPAVKRFEPSFGGPSAYALYGLSLGPVLVQVEGRHSRYEVVSTSVTGAVVFNFAGNWSLVGEVGVRIRHPSQQESNPQGDNAQLDPNVISGPPPHLHGAAGIRYAGDNFGFSLGAAYVGLTEPMLPFNGGSIPVIPALDLSWTFR